MPAAIVSETTHEIMEWILKHSLDLTAPHALEVEWDEHRGVLYVHVNGVTALRVCNVKADAMKLTITTVEVAK